MGVEIADDWLDGGDAEPNLYAVPADQPGPADEPTALDQLRAALVDTDGLDSIPEPQPLIQSILYRDSLAWLGGKRANGKSFIALDMAGCVANGLPWQDYHVPEALPVLYIAAEGVSGIRWRVRAWEAVNGPMKGVQWLPRPVLANTDEWVALRKLAAEMQPGLIVIDTQARVTTGLEENSAKDMGIFVAELDLLRKASDACVLVVHHQGHSGEHMRGSTAIEGAADTVIQVEKEDDLVTVKCTKQKNAAEFAPIDLRLVPQGDSAVLTPTGADDAAKTAALRFAAGWYDYFETEEVSPTALAEAAGVSRATVSRYTRILCSLDYAEMREAGGRRKVYRLRVNPKTCS